MMQQYLTWSANSNFCRKRKTRVLRVEIMGWGSRAEKNKYPNILEIFGLRAGPGWFLIRSLKLIFRCKNTNLFSISARSNYSQWIKWLDKITVIPRMRFRNHFLILMLLNTTFRQCFKGCNIFQRACRLVRLQTLTFTSKKSSESF